MAIDIKIEKKGIFKKKNTFQTILGCLDPEWKYGLTNGSMVLQDLDESMGEQELQTKYITVYDPNSIGRGFSVRYSDYEVELSLPLPCTYHDVDIFYQTIKEMMKKWKVSTYDEEGITCELHQISETIQQHKKWNLQQYIEMYENNSSHLLPCALHILAVDFVALFDESDEGEYPKIIEEYLHKLQAMDVFVPSAIIVRKKDSEDIRGIFVVSYEVDTVLRHEPFDIQTIQNNIELDWYISLVYPVNGETQSGILSYDAFKQIIDLNDYPQYDAGSVIFTLDDKELELLIPHIEQL